MYKALFGESIGTFVFVSCILYLQKIASANPIILAIAIGLSLAISIFIASMAGASAFLNPVVALACCLAGKITAPNAAKYVVAESIGALLAVLYLKNI